jgi:outer membrane protein assembly factor BamD (BamD/ComL family)
MVLTRHTAITVLLLLVLCQVAVPLLGQYGITLDIKKPPEYDTRVLGAEKSDKRKFGLPRRFIQNTVTHYNYFFNASNKLNEVLERAKASFKDDYSRLISFYNYTLDATAADSVQLDSVSYKSQTGIVLHDLRSDWADNLYLLWGASFYLQKEFDSAYLMFQFINYAFAEKEKDGYYRTIGSARDGNNAFIISTREKNSLPRRILSEPPSRNDAFIWQIRNYLAQDQFAQAASLIQALQADPVFPKRLHDDLEEVQAYSFYKQKMWDSSAAHLVLALGNATNKQEKARWEYLLGQLYETTGRNEEAETWYAKAISHTTDPIMDIYARLSSVRVNKDGGENYIEKNIATLIKMARRDKYQEYRDIIYYMAAQMELERKNVDGALALLLKSTQYMTNNPSQRNKAFLQLAELSFGKRQYRQAYNFYDSLRLDDPDLKDPDMITARKTMLGKIAGNIEIIERQDSLQRLAGLPEEERRDFIRKLARQLRRQQGLKDEGAGPASIFPQQPPSLFADAGRRGEWYFYNSNSRQKGLADFKAKWGARPNSDNWRRSSALTAIIRTQPGVDPMRLAGSGSVADNNTPETTEITFESLYDKLPLTPEKIKISDDSIQSALFNLGLLYTQELEDCSAATETFEQLRRRFPAHPQMDAVLFNLYFCYHKNGEAAKATAIKKLMTEKFGRSNFTTIVTTGKNPQSKGPGEEATKAYERIYDLFIEGNFREAIAQKKIADSLYSHNYWTPQLLYIEAVYYIKQREDSTAKTVLNNIISRFAGTPLATRATTLLDVLNRRAQIEQELRNLVINRPPADTSTRYRPALIPGNTNPVTAPQVQQDSVAAVISPPVQQPPVVITQPRVDTAGARPAQPPVTAYAFNSESPHYVVIILNKVDPIFVSEARNAFYRYNRDIYYNKQMQAELVTIDNDNRLLLISPFKNAQEALDYVERTRPRTASEIIPWLKGGKYSYSVITEKNLDLLKASKDIDKYTQFLQQHLPGRF